MAVEEVVSNIIHYGFKEKPLTSEVKIQLAHAGDTIQICITDQGIAFNTLQVPPPEDLDKPARERKVGGLGIYLIRNMMDQVEYRRENENNILLLTKKLNTANGAENIQNIH
jgi:anti-sigma regulatory factor (Ser/Thr protein kinase)